MQHLALLLSVLAAPALLLTMLATAVAVLAGHLRRCADGAADGQEGEGRHHGGYRLHYRHLMDPQHPGVVPGRGRGHPRCVKLFLHVMAVLLMLVATRSPQQQVH